MQRVARDRQVDPVEEVDQNPESQKDGDSPSPARHAWAARNGLRSGRKLATRHGLDCAPSSTNSRDPATGTCGPTKHRSNAWVRQKLLDADAGEQAAVHEVIASSAESRLIRRQKRSQFSNLFGRADALKRMSRPKTCEHFFDRQIRGEVCRGTCQHGRADRTWADRIHADI